MLKIKDFDFYYLIICSRGPGSETITINRVGADPPELSEEELEEMNGEGLMEFDEFAEDNFSKF